MRFSKTPVSLPLVYLGVKALERKATNLKGVRTNILRSGQAEAQERVPQAK